MNISSTYPQFIPMGDQCILVRFGDKISDSTNRCAVAYARMVSELSIPGIIEIVPSYTEVAVYYNALEVDYTQISEQLQKVDIVVDQQDKIERRLIRIPVCYGGQFGPDIAHVSSCNGITEEELIRIHTSTVYPVYMLGFTPGFCYLGNMSKQIACPRKSTPRNRITAGSVGIAGEQTGIYPIESPGGWQLIGRTPVKLFDPNRQPSTLTAAGDAVEFYPISEEEFRALASDGDRNE